MSMLDRRRSCVKKFSVLALGLTPRPLPMCPRNLLRERPVRSRSRMKLLMKSSENFRLLPPD